MFIALVSRYALARLVDCCRVKFEFKDMPEECLQQPKTFGTCKEEPCLCCGRVLSVACFYFLTILPPVILMVYIPFTCAREAWDDSFLDLTLGSTLLVFLVGYGVSAILQLFFALVAAGGCCWKRWKKKELHVSLVDDNSDIWPALDLGEHGEGCIQLTAVGDDAGDDRMFYSAMYNESFNFRLSREPRDLLASAQSVSKALSNGDNDSAYIMGLERTDVLCDAYLLTMRWNRLRRGIHVMAITVLFASMSTLSDFNVRSEFPKGWLIILTCLSIDNAFFDLYSALHTEKRHGETKEVLRRDRQYTYEVPPSFKPFSGATKSGLAPDPPGSFGSLGFLVCRSAVSGEDSGKKPDPLIYNDGIRVTMDRLGFRRARLHGQSMSRKRRT